MFEVKIFTLYPDLYPGPLNTGIYKKDLRIDPAPRWNHDNNKILVSGLDKNGIRQLFVMSVDY